MRSRSRGSNRPRLGLSSCSATARGVPEGIWSLLDDVVEIPMVGQGASLNVAVAGSLVLYRLAGLA